MPKGIGITKQQKKQVAFEFINGRPLSDIAEQMGISPVTLYRLRSTDPDYQRYEAELEQAAVDALRIRLKRAVGEILGTLMDLSRLDHANEVTKEVFTRTDSSGRKIRTEKRSVARDPKLTLVRFAACTKVLDAYLRTLDSESAHQAVDEWLERREALLRAYGVSPPTAPARPPLPLTAATVEPEGDGELTDLLRQLGDGGGEG
jgi:AcrR family transcriptional regulator